MKKKYLLCAIALSLGFTTCNGFCSTSTNDELAAHQNIPKQQLTTELQSLKRQRKAEGKLNVKLYEQASARGWDFRRSRDIRERDGLDGEDEYVLPPLDQSNNRLDTLDNLIIETHKALLALASEDDQ